MDELDDALQQVDAELLAARAELAALQAQIRVQREARAALAAVVDALQAEALRLGQDNLELEQVLQESRTRLEGLRLQVDKLPPESE